MALNLNDNCVLLLLLYLLLLLLSRLKLLFFYFWRLSLIQTFMRLLKAGDFQNLLRLVILNITPSFIIKGFLGGFLSVFKSVFNLSLSQRNCHFF